MKIRIKDQFYFFWKTWHVIWQVQSKADALGVSVVQGKMDMGLGP